MSQPARSFSFTATTQSGRMMSFELPLHAQTASSENVARLLEGLLDALSDLIERCQGVSDGDVLQGLSLAMAVRLGVDARDARLFMIADKRWKFIHAEGGFRPLLFDLESDPDEFVDLGASSAHAPVLDMMYQLPSQTDVKEVVISKEVVLNKTNPLVVMEKAG